MIAERMAGPTLILTGGGTAGHVTPNLALVSGLRAQGWHLEYIGARNGMEQDLAIAAGLPYHGIATGKLRRYFSWQNFRDPFNVVWGLAEAWRLLGRLQPRAVFSKGGFVTVPVVLAAALRQIPVLLHESDFTPGLASRLTIPLAHTVCTAFPETAARIPGAIAVGLPLRAELGGGDRARGLQHCGFTGTKPVLVVVGGSSGSVVLNRCVRAALPQLLPHFDVVHGCGKGNLDPDWQTQPGYYQQEYFAAEWPHVLAAAEIALSRAGANTLFEWLALRLPHLVVPLSRRQSRGDQILNAQSFARQGFSQVLAEEDLNPDTLCQNLFALYRDRDRYRQAMAAQPPNQAVAKLLELIARLRP
ncbi:MAG: undecaprenyldiphospho-muramoylpentapeptide beta-N-acetylglucosaminyltransferase [Pseudanabaenaceae cyanobacterium]